MVRGGKGYGALLGSVNIYVSLAINVYCISLKIIESGGSNDRALGIS